MKKIASNLFHHKALVIADPASQPNLSKMLQASGFDVVCTHSLAGAMGMIDQELPHLVVTQGWLPDGHARKLKDRLAKNYIHKRIPVLVSVKERDQRTLSMLSET